MKPLLAVGFLALAACSSEIGTSDPAPAPAPAVERTPDATNIAHAAPTTHNAMADGDRALDIGSALAGTGRGTALPFVCPMHSFCADFEAPNFTAWTDVVARKGGEIDLAQESASTGGGALRLYAREVDAAAFLVLEQADVAAAWAGSFGFAFRVDEVPSKYLGGPELSVKTSDGPVSLRIAMTPEGLVLEQLSDPSCLIDRCQPQSMVIAAAQPNHWYRVSLGVEAAPQKAHYGHVEVRVDGGELHETDLTVPFFSGSIVLRAGLTQGDARPTIADLDDLTLLLRQ